MRKTRMLTRFLSFFLLFALTAAVAMFAIGCDGKNDADNATTTVAATTVAGDASNVRGEGDTEFSFTVVKKDGTKATYTVKTDKKTVGDALFDAGLIKGEEGQFGLYVTEVDGEYHKYEEDGYYWAFYENGDYALAGVDSTDIKSGTEYMLKASKG